MFGLRRILDRHKVKRSRRHYVKTLIKTHFPNMSPRGRQKDFYTAFGRKINFLRDNQLTIPTEDVKRLHAFIMDDFPMLRDPSYLLTIAIDYTVSKRAEVAVRCDQRNLMYTTVY